jgi:rubredoxin
MGELEKISRKALQNSSLFDPCTTAIAHNKKPLDTLADKEKCEDPGSLSSSAGVGGAGDPVTPFAKKRKRGKLTAAESGYECRPRVGGASERTSGVGEGEIEFACKSCDKTFRLEQVLFPVTCSHSGYVSIDLNMVVIQGARTHVYMVHILTSGTDSDIYSKCAIGEPVGPTEVPSTTCLQEEPAGSDSLYCPICEVPEKLSFIVVDTAEGLRRSFSSPDALQQHMRAKHASPSAAPPAEETKTDTTRTTSYVFSDDAPSTGGDMYGVYVCGLCGLALDSPEGLERHLSEGVAPPPVCQLLCASCGRTFVNERALRQHAVACNSHIKSLYDAM